MPTSTTAPSSWSANRWSHRGRSSSCHLIGWKSHRAQRQLTGWGRAGENDKSWVASCHRFGLAAKRRKRGSQLLFLGGPIAKPQFTRRFNPITGTKNQRRAMPSITKWDRSASSINTHCDRLNSRPQYQVSGIIAGLTSDTGERCVSRYAS